MGNMVRPAVSNMRLMDLSFSFKGPRLLGAYIRLRKFFRASARADGAAAMRKALVSTPVAYGRTSVAVDLRTPLVSTPKPGAEKEGLPPSRAPGSEVDPEGPGSTVPDPSE